MTNQYMNDLTDSIQVFSTFQQMNAYFGLCLCTTLLLERKFRRLQSWSARIAQLISSIS